MDLKKFKVIINIILILIIVCLYLLEKRDYEEPKDKIDKDIMSITNNQTNNQIVELIIEIIIKSIIKLNDVLKFDCLKILL